MIKDTLDRAACLSEVNDGFSDAAVAEGKGWCITKYFWKKNNWLVVFSEVICFILKTHGTEKQPGRDRSDHILMLKYIDKYETLFCKPATSVFVDMKLAFERGHWALLAIRYLWTEYQKSGHICFISMSEQSKSN